MKINFEPTAVAITEFGIGREVNGDPRFGMVPVDAGVKSALLSMAQATMDKMEVAEDGPSEYEPGEKHSSTGYLFVPAGAVFGAAVRELHDAENLSFDDDRLSQPESIFCYFA